MNTLGLKCSIRDKKANLTAVISLDNGEIHKHLYKSPSIFSFKKNSGELLNWHRENVISLITNFKIEGVSIRKTERESFNGRPKNSDIFKLYLEGVLLSLAGSMGIFNKHYYKTDVKFILDDPDIFEKEIETIATEKEKNLCFTDTNALDKTASKEAFLAVLSLEKEYTND